MRHICLLLIVLCLSCTNDDIPNVEFDNTITLAQDLQNILYQSNAIPSFAGSDEINNELINVYFNIEENASNFKYYESVFTSIDSSDLSRYNFKDLIPEIQQDSTFGNFEIISPDEQWIIISYEVGNKIKLSSPIRTKNISQQTTFNQNIEINQSNPSKPRFDWEVISEENNVQFLELVFFEEMLLSKTFTNDNYFQYDNSSNIIQNLNDEDFPNLIEGQTYSIMIMDLSLDNWINSIISTTFINQ